MKLSGSNMVEGLINFVFNFVLRFIIKNKKNKKNEI